MISPRSSSKSGFSPSASVARLHRLAEVFGRDPGLVLEGHEGLDQRRGQDAAEVGDRPPRSAQPSLAHHLVVAEALAALDRPAEEGDLGVEARAVDRAGADQRAGAAQRLARPRRRATAPASPGAAPRPAPYSVESSASETSTGAPSGPQRTAATASSPWLGGAVRPHRAETPAGRRRRRRSRSTAAGSGSAPQLTGAETDLDAR